LSIIKHVTLQKIVAHDFRYDPHSNGYSKVLDPQHFLFSSVIIGGGLSMWDRDEFHEIK